MNNSKYWIPIVFIGFLLVLIIALPHPNSSKVPKDRVVQIEASQFAFSPGTIRVDPGDHVVMEIKAADVVHGLYIDGYDISVTADPGQTAKLEFIADRAGSFRLRCSVACGDMHPFMIGRLHVGTNWLFWRGTAFILVMTFALIWLVNYKKKWT